MDLNNTPIDIMFERQGSSTFLVYEDLFGETKANEEELYDGFNGTLVVLGETSEGIFEQEI